MLPCFYFLFISPPIFLHSRHCPFIYLNHLLHSKSLFTFSCRHLILLNSLIWPLSTPHLYIHSFCTLPPWFPFPKLILTHTSSLSMSLCYSLSLSFPALFQASIGHLPEASHHSRLITAIVWPGPPFYSSVFMKSSIWHPHHPKIYSLTLSLPLSFSLSLASDVPLTFSQAHLHQFHTSNALPCQCGR